MSVLQLYRSECMHMRQWRRANRCPLSCERRRELCVVQHRIHSQPRQDSVYSYVLRLLGASKPVQAHCDMRPIMTRFKVCLHTCVVILQRIRAHARTVWHNLARVARLTALQNAPFARPDGRSATTERSVYVRARHSACMRAEHRI